MFPFNYIYNNNNANEKDLNQQDNMRSVMLNRTQVHPASEKKGTRSVNRNMMNMMRSLKPASTIIHEPIEIPSFNPEFFRGSEIKEIEEKRKQFEAHEKEQMMISEGVRQFNTTYRMIEYQPIPFHIMGVVDMNTYNQCLDIYLNNQSLARQMLEQKKSLPILKDTYLMELWFCSIIEPKPVEQDMVKNWKLREKRKLIEFNNKGYFCSADCDTFIKSLFEESVYDNRVYPIIQGCDKNELAKYIITQSHLAVGLEKNEKNDNYSYGWSP